MWGPILRVYLVFFPGKKKVEVSFCQIVTETESEKLKGLDMTYQLSIHWYCLLVHRTMLLGFQSFGKKLSGQSLPILKSYEGLNTHCQSGSHSSALNKPKIGPGHSWFVFVWISQILHYLPWTWYFGFLTRWKVWSAKGEDWQRKKRRKIFGEGKYLVSAGE